MPGRIRALAATVLTAAAVLGNSVIGPAAAGPRDRSAAQGLHVVKTFDFDERPLGNFESLPMRWQRYAGAGFPAYSAGALDDEFGHDAPPSFRIDLRGGNVGYQYAASDILVTPAADYRVEAYIRAVGLRHARALVHAYLVDRAGEPVAGSDRLSDVVASQAAIAADEPWQHVEATVSGSFPNAYALRIGLWITQPRTWLPPNAAGPDPVRWQDVRAAVWFDDLVVYQVPRMDLRLSSGANLILPGETVELLIDTVNPGERALSAEVVIADADGREHHRSRHELPARAPVALRVPVPRLDPGLYRARVGVEPTGASKPERTLQFAALPELRERGLATADFGIELGCASADAIGDAVALTRALGCGAVKLRVPLADGSSADDPANLREFVRALLEAHIDVTGVLHERRTDGRRAAGGLLPGAASGRHEGARLCERLAPLDGLITSWQIGDGPDDRSMPAPPEHSDAVSWREILRGAVAAPELIVPHSVLAWPGAAALQDDADVVSLCVPADVPARSFPLQLTAVAPGARGSNRAPRCWVAIETRRDGAMPRLHLLDLARRVVLARALGAERVYVPAPITPVLDGGRVSWQPTDEFVLLRTLFHFLSGKHVIGVVPLVEQDGVAIVFEGATSACAVLWTWRDQAPDEPVELHAGPRVTAWGLTGNSVPVELADSVARVRPTPEPVILDGVDRGLLLVQASLRVEPANVILDGAEPRPVLRIRNHFSQPLSGTVEFDLPHGWTLPADSVPVEIEAGATFELPLALQLPRLEVAVPRTLTARVRIRRPMADVLTSTVHLTPRLRDIELEASARFSGDDLRVEQVLRNFSAETVSFQAYCQAPGLVRLEGAFVDVGAGDSDRQTYIYRNARQLAGETLRLGVREVRGMRALDQLVEIPD